MDAFGVQEAEQYAQKKKARSKQRTFVFKREKQLAMSDWTYLINICFGAAGLMMSVLGLILCVTSNLIETRARYHMIGIFAALAGYSGTVIPGYLPIHPDLILLSIFLSSALSAAMMPVITSFILYFTGEKPMRSGLFLSVSLLLLVYYWMLVSTFFAPYFYSVDAKGVYTRGPLYALLLVPPVLIMLMNLSGLLMRRKRLSGKQFRAFLAIILFPLISMVIQMFFYGILTTALGVMIGSLALFLYILSDQQDRFIQVTEENANRQFAIRILQMRPHFIYNAMTSIYYIVEEDPVRARSVIRDFSIYLRRVFGSVTSRVPVSFSEELEHTRAYLSVESARFSDQLRVSYDIRHTDFFLPPLTLQPIVENAIKHGMDPEVELLSVMIRTRHADGVSEITVENDGENYGVPFDEEGEKGVGLGSTVERLKRMCGGDMEIAQREGGGTIVTIRIPDRGSGG